MFAEMGVVERIANMNNEVEFGANAADYLTRNVEGTRIMNGHINAVYIAITKLSIRKDNTNLIPFAGAVATSANGTNAW